ncbi:dihydrofolate reductase family protein [Pelobium sp.]|nr:dihydrofolate reductase family protein [Pelobium sp.]MDA9555387.1 dihydrofolate reductase family protein [Pelobium sp.]
MRKLILQMNTTVDGFVGGKKGEMNWLEQNQDAKFIKLYQKDIINSVDTLLMGRKMTKVFVSYWENIVDNEPDNLSFEFAKKLVDIPKIVFSKKIKTVAGKNITVENGDLVTVIKKLKKKKGKDILVYGGANFVSSLIKNNLIDEFNFFIHRTAIGSGLKIFTDTKNLKLIASKSYECGVIANQYKPDNK